MNFQDPAALAEGINAMLTAPDEFEVVVEELGRGGRRVRIQPRVISGVEDVLPRADAWIEIIGTGRFVLRLDGTLGIDEIYDHDDEGVLEILSGFCAIAENYLGGAGTITRRSDHVSVVLAAGDDEFLLEGRLPAHPR
ncbi:hypothetical protein C6I20_10005 [Aeromicrobium sp. A1-2]|uniref:hypothetical protein n=1 Tax=Aeromicrobium sp. A1-2 TaxID=2107713 RepID=UPI000E49505B|nr:hypothetical protein [Aeromicrobium sp. A1-2]AXT85489.1 hypothetical protein C6I20_10005 [Aeromicrobium sp. A1-2]